PLSLHDALPIYGRPTGDSVSLSCFDDPEYQQKWRSCQQDRTRKVEFHTPSWLVCRDENARSDEDEHDKGYRYKEDPAPPEKLSDDSGENEAKHKPAASNCRPHAQRA